MLETVVVVPVLQARVALSEILARIRKEGGQATPVVVGSYRRPEAVGPGQRRERRLGFAGGEVGGVVVATASSVAKPASHCVDHRT